MAAELHLTINPVNMGLLRIAADQDALERWAGALVSGAYKLGNDTLRTGDDVFDAFGVLADLHHAEWVWDEFEDAWTLVGDAYIPRVGDVRRWLGVSPSVPDSRVNEFIRRVQAVSLTDGGKSLAGLLPQMLEKESLFTEMDRMLHRLRREEPRYLRIDNTIPLRGSKSRWMV
ncbi:hypothetical protein KIKIMORA_02640 [Brevundimonas phage vB_BpoS-Kikimora]|uniref:Uncharacterized protein n=1 Tax=Brevundimonas phage vB_BpoS-Kikimora TaxID=2948601 RepID=A0A9E7MSS5_9CAUD|nr:hypothetical protein KIKIMORA_02640 [Brevundimonas phage vB_BpoS-Kikimora]